MREQLVKFSTLALAGVSKEVPLFGPFGEYLAQKTVFEQAYKKMKDLFEGTVTAYNPQTHTAQVKVDATSSIWTCVFADEKLSFSFGYSETSPVREGERVFVARTTDNANFGIVIGRLPYKQLFSANGGDKYSDPDQYHRRHYTQDDKKKETWDRNVPCFNKALEDEKNTSTHISTHYRPTDVYPGEFARLNQHDCGFVGGLFSASLVGGGARLRMSALTNQARLSCDSYRRISMSGNVNEFHNARFLSTERDYAIYQEERLGGTKKQDEVWDEDAEAPKEGEKQTIRPRMKDLSGFFGHLKSSFCMRPDPTESGIRKLGEGEPKEEGVSRETFDPSGQYRLSAAGMIAIERTGRIPVPVRKCSPNDKGHDHEKPEVLKAFEHDESDPCYRQLELFDRQAYDLKTQYSRVDGLGLDEPDYDVPQEEDLKPLKDKYDEKFDGNETVKLEKYDKRRAGMYIGEDGSVIVRDAWGSEIVMLGGNVTISCAGNVMTLPGKTSLTIAGDDIVQKAQNSVDIHASEHDVRLSAARNMEILGGGDESKYSGGVIIESRGNGASPWDGKDKGESARVSGITLKAKNQAVVVDGKKINLRSGESTQILSGKDGLDGRITIASDTLLSRSNRTTLSSGEAAVMVSGSSAVVASQTTSILGTGVNIIKGSQALVPLKWQDGAPSASELTEKINSQTEFLSDESSASEGFERSELDKMMFGFRSSDECGTTKPWAIGGKGDKFRMYEPAWVQVMKIYDTLKKASVDSRPYEENPEWENGKPFPGKDAEDSAEYAQLSGLKPKNLTSDGFNASRKTVKEKSEISPVKLKGGYLVRK